MADGSEGSIEIRRMRPDELEIVAAVWYESLTTSLSWMRPDQLVPKDDRLRSFRWYSTSMPGKPAPDVWLAVADGEIVAMMALEEEDGVAQLDRLYVATSAQRRGIGTALLDHAKALHPRGLETLTLERNEPACRFYERHGFEVVGHGVSPPPENEPDVAYRWPGATASR